MAPATAPENQTPFDDEISLLVIIQFFKTNFKRILFFIVMGGFIGFFYGKLAGPVYSGSVLISPARVEGMVVVNPKITLTKLNVNSFYPKETFQACNPKFYKDKDIDYDMSDIVKPSITRDGTLIELKMESSKKEIIHACLEKITDNINASQKIYTDPLIESKKNELRLAEEKLKLAEDFHEHMNGKQIKILKTNDQRYTIDLLYANMILNHTREMEALFAEIRKHRTMLSSAQTNDASIVLPISIEQKSFPSEKLGLLLGLFLGLFFGVLITLIKRIKI